ncbi:hypothetical protein Tco_1268557, partial [Tanacetum coccineum]
MLAKNNAECHEEVNEKIKIALKLLNLRDMCYLIQFWSLYGTGKYKFLKTVNQPFGLGIYEEGLCSYRKESERKWLPVDAKAAKLTSPQAFDFPPMSYVDCNNTQRGLDEIFKTIKEVCEAYKLPLAQTWTISSKSSFVAT